jgi:hypothetical protein
MKAAPMKPLMAMLFVLGAGVFAISQVARMPLDELVRMMAGGLVGWWMLAEFARIERRELEKLEAFKLEHPELLVGRFEDECERDRNRKGLQ